MRVLVIDDDEDLLKLLRLRLEAAGHVVVTHAHGLGVISQLAAWDDDPFDVCILDNWMPAANGIDLLRLAAKTNRARDVPVIFYSADSGLLDAVESVGHPNTLYLVKGHVSEVIDAVDLLATTGKLTRM